MLMTFLSGVYLLKMFLQGHPGETIKEKRMDQGGESASKPPLCPSWTTQEELDGMAGDIYGEDSLLLFLSLDSSCNIIMRCE